MFLRAILTLPFVFCAAVAAAEDHAGLDQALAALEQLITQGFDSLEE